MKGNQATNLFIWLPLVSLGCLLGFFGMELGGVTFIICVASLISRAKPGYLQFGLAVGAFLLGIGMFVVGKPDVGLPFDAQFRHAFFVSIWLLTLVICCVLWVRSKKRRAA